MPSNFLFIYKNHALVHMNHMNRTEEDLFFVMFVSFLLFPLSVNRTEEDGHSLLGNFTFFEQQTVEQ